MGKMTACLQKDQGVVLVELAAGLLFLILVLSTGVSGHSRLFSQQSSIAAAAHAGARAAAKYDWRDKSAADWRAESANYDDTKLTRLVQVGVCTAANSLNRAGFDFQKYNISVTFIAVPSAAASAPAVQIAIAPKGPGAGFSFLGKQFTPQTVTSHMIWEPPWDSSIPLPALPSSANANCTGA